MSKPVDLDKLRSINIGGSTAGKSRVRRLRDDDSGDTTGYQIDHDDGRREAVVRPATIQAQMSVSTGKVHSGDQ